MPVPLGQLPPDVVAYVEGLEARIGDLEDPKSPKPVYACAAANLPDAADFINCVAHVTDVPILVASDGTDWIRQDTGVAI